MTKFFLLQIDSEELGFQRYFFKIIQYIFQLCFKILLKLRIFKRKLAKITLS